MNAARKKKSVVQSGRAIVAKPKARADALGSDIRELILAARESVAQAVNAGLTTLYWQIGTRIRQDILKEKRAEYGREAGIRADGRRSEHGNIR